MKEYLRSVKSRLDQLFRPNYWRKRRRKNAFALNRRLARLVGEDSLHHELNVGEEVLLHLDHPITLPRDASSYATGWIASVTPIQAVSLATSPAVSARLLERQDVKETLGHYPCVTGFSIPLASCDIIDGTIQFTYTAAGRMSAHTASLVLESEMPSCLRKRKQHRIVGIAACVSCRGALEMQGEYPATSLHCMKCGATFHGDSNRFDFLTEELRQECHVASTDNVSANPYDAASLALIARFPDGLILDCGAGKRPNWYPNVISLEVAPYPTTDVLGVNERLPFQDESFDAVLSLAVLEHVANPFQSASEILRVLKKGGILYAAVPLLQPVHGYPSHYYNMTAQGLANLFSPRIGSIEQYVLPSGHPVWTLNWLVQAWASGLEGKTKKRFLDTPLRDFLTDPNELLGNAVVAELDLKTCFEIASMTTLLGVKKE